MEAHVLSRFDAKDTTLLQKVLSNRLYNIASRSRGTTPGTIAYWETYARFLREHRSKMTNEDAIQRCNDTLSDIDARVGMLRRVI